MVRPGSRIFDRTVQDDDADKAHEPHKSACWVGYEYIRVQARVDGQVLCSKDCAIGPGWKQA